MLIYFFALLFFLAALIAGTLYAMLKIWVWYENRTLNNCAVHKTHFVSFWLDNHGLSPEFLTSIEAVQDGAGRVHCYATYAGFNSYEVKINTYTLILTADYLSEWEQDIEVLFDNQLYPNV